MTSMQSSSTDKFDDDEESDEDDQSLMAKEDSDTKPEDLLGLMATSYSNINDEEEPEVSFRDIKNNIHTYTKKKLVSLSRVLIDAYHKLFAEKNQLMNDYASLRFENKDLEVSRQNLKFFYHKSKRTGFLHQKIKKQLQKLRTRNFLMLILEERNWPQKSRRKSSRPDLHKQYLSCMKTTVVARKV